VKKREKATSFLAAPKPSGHYRIQSVIVTRTGWLIVTAAVLALAAVTGVHFWIVRPPPKPPSATLPLSARSLLQSFRPQQPLREDRFDLPLAANGVVEYRVAMQAGATLVFSWTASHGMVSCQFANQNPLTADGSHSAFEAQSSGWYRWRWKNPNGSAVTIHLKLNGYYEPAGMPYDR